MDPNDPLANLTPQQILQLASMAHAQLMRQGQGSSQPQLFAQPFNSSMQPQPHSAQAQQGANVMMSIPQHTANSGGYTTGVGQGFMSASGGAQASNEGTQAQSPAHHNPVDIEETSPPPKNNPPRRGATNGTRKGKKVGTDQEAQRIKQDNFAPLEDRLLVTSWLEISCDPMTNTGQDNLTFWSRITNLYNSKRGSYPARTLRSLQSRYDLIKKPVAKFASYYADVVRRNPSGMSDADKTSLACSEYASVEPKPFKFMHVWDIMKDNPKFQDTKHGRSFRGDMSTMWEDQLFDPPATQQASEETCPTPSSTTSKRPLGRDAAKRASKCSCPSTPTGSDFAHSMQDLLMKYDENHLTSKNRNETYMAWKREQEEEARQDRKIMIELEREKLAIEKQKLKLKEMQSEIDRKRVEMMYTEQEERILGIDLSKFPEPLRSYYKRKQLEIQGRTEEGSSQE